MKTKKTKKTKVEKGCGDTLLIYEEVFFPGEWDWKINTKWYTSGLYQKPETSFWRLICPQ